MGRGEPWIDVIVQPVASFTLNERGEHVGALGDGKPLHLILTRSSAYHGRHLELVDFQRPHLECIAVLGSCMSPKIKVTSVSVLYDRRARNVIGDAHGIVHSPA